MTELWERLGIASTMFELVRTLERQELVEQDAETGKYRLGRRCRNWATPFQTTTSCACARSCERTRSRRASARPSASEQVADVGAAAENQEAIVGEGEIAAPIFDHRGVPVGAIGVAGPVERLLPAGPAEPLTAAVRETARGLSRDMGRSLAARYRATPPYVAMNAGSAVRTLLLTGTRFGCL